ncbi:hypothetical protein Q5H89_12865 [Hymenobacter sp. CA2-7]|nr:hypothetical protein [Hymenobacter sp. CA2-7]
MPAALLIRKCLRVGRNSLLLGTAMLVLFFFSNDLSVAFLSVPVVLVLGLYNLKRLLQLLWRAQLEPENRRAFWRAGLIMSLNLPVALLYAMLVHMLNNALLVRVVNDTSQPLRDVVVQGCGPPRPLADLPPGQATIVWLPIGRDCFERTVSVQYRVGSATQQTMIDGYVVEGRRLNVKLGSHPPLAAAKP